MSNYISPHRCDALSTPIPTDIALAHLAVLSVKAQSRRECVASKISDRPPSLPDSIGPQLRGDSNWGILPLRVEGCYLPA
jgi:hypothetical protein